MTHQPEVPVLISCAGDKLVGILHPADGADQTGIVIVVGGPQYRVGSHRQFVIMARHLAAAGYPVLRFDYRGMGDSNGASRTFENVAEDIRGAVDYLIKSIARVKTVVLLGLCDAASAIMMYCCGDSRIEGMILLNPWVRTSQGEAESYLRHYYLQRFLTRDFWRKVLLGNFGFRESIQSLAGNLLAARRTSANPADSVAGDSFIDRMRRGLAGFDGRVLLLISGRDLTAQEFMDLCRKSKAWKQTINRPNIEFRKFPLADHTLSSRKELDNVVAACVLWARRK